jgi:hypothetical protein
MRLDIKLIGKLQNANIAEYIWKDRPQSMIVAYAKYLRLSNNFLSTTE